LREQSACLAITSKCKASLLATKHALKRDFYEDVKEMNDRKVAHLIPVGKMVRGLADQNRRGKRGKLRGSCAWRDYLSDIHNFPPCQHMQAWPVHFGVTPSGRFTAK
jgi:hypothetical protein